MALNRGARKRKEAEASDGLDYLGYPIEAPSAKVSSFIVTAEDHISSVTSEPIEIGGTYLAGGEVHQTGPNGAFVWYVSGAPGAVVQEKLTRVENSGGHSHGGETSDPAAVATVSPAGFVLQGPYPQNFRIVQRASDVCGSIIITSTYSVGDPFTVINQLDVSIPGLQQIPGSANLRLKAPLPEHPSPYWGTPDFIQKLVSLANGYAAETGKPIVITDGSLPTGGRFDLGTNWHPPHHEHMDGGQRTSGATICPTRRRSFSRKSRSRSDLVCLSRATTGTLGAETLASRQLKA